MLHDQRPALLVAGDGSQEVHPLRDEFHGARVRGPRVGRRADGVEDCGNALRVIPGTRQEETEIPGASKLQISRVWMLLTIEY